MALELSVVVLLELACQSKHELTQQYSDSGVNLENEINKKALPSRAQLLLQLKENSFDVLIIGGGATGAGAALDAVTRGLKVALVEAQDFSFGTSSRSTKLVHGGVRYLENAVKKFDRHEYSLVRDALQERKHFLENAPHLTNPLPILTPVYSWFEAFYFWVGLKLYDLVAGDSSLGTSKFIARKEALDRFPQLKKEKLKGAVVYYDGQFDDARMNLSIILSAIKLGASALNYVRAEALLKENNTISGIIATNILTNERWPIRARIVINATGPFADRIRHMDDKTAQNTMIPSQGSHILLPARFSPPHEGLIIPKTKDGRVLFLLPWMNKTLAGTTDHLEKITETPHASRDEVEYILEHLRLYFDVPATREDILATWSGLRPLARPEYLQSSTASISRDHLIEVSNSKLITIVGGKWTTYRKMGEDVINIAIKTAQLSPAHKSATQNLKLVGAHNYNKFLKEELERNFKHAPDISFHLAHAYGDQAHIIITLIKKNPQLSERLVENYPYISAEVLYTLNHEYAEHAVDIIARRMRLAFLDNKAALKALPNIINLMASNLNWSQPRIEQEYRHARKFLSTMLTL